MLFRPHKEEKSLNFFILSFYSGYIGRITAKGSYTKEDIKFLLPLSGQEYAKYSKY